MKWLYCIIIILGLQISSYSQAGWYQQAIGTTEDLTSVYFINKDTGWVTGEDGLLLKTVNGGNTWISNTANLSGIEKILFIDNQNGFLVGYNSNGGTLLKSTDGGNTWNEKQTLMGAFDYPSDLFFINQNIGWLILRADEMSSGPYMQKTTDGGESWIELQNCPFSGEMNSFESIFFIDVNNGWLGTAGFGHLYRTIDGGENWTESLNSYFPERFYDIFFWDINLGWTICSACDTSTQNSYNLIYNTNNGGSNWNIQFYDTTYSELRSIHFVNADFGWACGDYGEVLYTTNGGNEWIEQVSGSNNRLNQIFFVNENMGWSVGSNGTILHTTTGGVIPVELTSFSASISGDKVTLDWTTASETNNSGFEVERKADKSDWSQIGFVAGHGTTTELQSYSFVDDVRSLRTRELSYRLKQTDFDGSFEYSEVINVENLTPIDFALQQNYPNPFNPTTTIEFSIPVKSYVELVVYNSLGERVVQLINGVKEAGNHEVEFDASKLTSGVYLYKLRAGDLSEIRKMILIK